MKCSLLFLKSGCVLVVADQWSAFGRGIFWPPGHVQVARILMTRLLDDHWQDDSAKYLLVVVVVVVVVIVALGVVVIIVIVFAEMVVVNVVVVVVTPSSEFTTKNNQSKYRTICILFIEMLTREYLPTYSRSVLYSKKKFMENQHLCYY